QITFDPIYTTAVALGFMAKAIHAKLVSYGEGAELRPELAERWDVFEGGQHYRFYLRRDVRFHNGRLFEAKDVYESLLRLVLPENKSTSSWILRHVRGAEEVMNGKTRQLEGIVVRDPHTVDILLDEPLAFFVSLLSMHECSIVPVEETRDPERFRLRAPGAGPYRIEEVIEGERVRLVRNRHYFVPGQPLLEELVFRLDLRTTREVADAFLRGELDIAHGIPLITAKELRNDPSYAPYLLTTTQLHTSYFGYDTSSAPFNRVEVRQAVNYAIDRHRINDRLFGGQGLIARGLLPPGLVGHDSNLRGYDHDPDRARSLLRQAGYAAGFKVEYRTWETDEFYNSGMVPLIIEDLAEVGIEVNVTKHATADARKPLQKRGHGNVFCGNWFADFPDPDNFFFVFFHSESASVAGINFQRAEVDADIEAARKTNDLEERTTIYRRLDAMVVKEAPIAPLFHERLFVGHKPYVRGVRTSLVQPPVRYNDVWLEKTE
ncbi:MAG TPA: ABC transporter substrate-binding protein, partial [Thermoanaerobaculia bacterium]